jgi:hypothetical protein
MEDDIQLHPYISNKVTRGQLEYMLQIVQGSLAKGAFEENLPAECGLLTQTEADQLVRAIIAKLNELG